MSLHSIILLAVLLPLDRKALILNKILIEVKFSAAAH